MNSLYYYTDARFARAGGSRFYFYSSLPRNFFDRYLSQWDRIYMVTRIKPIEAPVLDGTPIADDRVAFIPLPDYQNTFDYFAKMHTLKSILEPTVRAGGSVLLRVGSTLSHLVISSLSKIQKPFGLEVVGDPYDVFSPGAVRHPLRPIFRWWFSRQLRYQCQQACAVSYVTQKALQTRYPPSSKAFSTYYSNVELNNDAYADKAKRYTSSKKSYKLIFVGTLNQFYKAPDILIRAFQCCIKDGFDVSLDIVGDGQYRLKLESLLQLYNIKDRVHFLGRLPAGEAVRAELDKADLFVLPSRQEGLPRAMIEAMARGLPCIGSNVGGIPELLPPEDMVPPGDVQALASKIKEVIRDPERMNRMAERNWKKAHEYHDDILRERRNAFYQYVKEKTEEWQRQQGLR